MNNSTMHTVASVLLIVGGLNWLLDAFGWNVVEMIFGAGSTLTMIVYVLVGLAALYELFTHRWSSSPAAAM